MQTYQYPSKTAEKKLDAIENRSIGFKKKDVTAVTRILDDIKKNGDEALIRYTNRFDSPVLRKTALKVTRQEMTEAEKRVKSDLMPVTAIRVDGRFRTESRRRRSPRR